MTRRTVRIVLCLIAVALPGVRPTLVERPTRVAEIREPELRLRKLYLVRPDLLHYPIPYDVVC